ncbi:MAG: DUF3782 domain-containing protein [Verrucomicrobiota bacterium]
MSDAELKAIIADLARRQAEEHAKTESAQRRTEETLRRVTAQLGGLGNKFGSFTEGLAFASMRRVLRRHFHVDDVSMRRLVHRNGQAQEFDMVGVANGKRREVYLVEIKSELNEEELQKYLRKLQAFFDYFPVYRGLKLYGIISAVDVRGALADRVLREGLYLATAGDENFKLVKPPRAFKPKVFTAQ